MVDKLPYKCDFCNGQLEVVFWSEERQAFLVRCSVCRRWKWWEIKDKNKLSSAQKML